MRLQGLLFLWIGLMGLGGTFVVWLLVRAFPQAFSDSGPSVAWPWRSEAGKAPRLRGGLLFAAAVASAFVAAVGIFSLLS
jgi:hypothetical protein